MRPEQYNIPKEKLVFHKTDNQLHDLKLDTKPVSYFKDAFYRFSRNKASIIAAIIIIMLVLFAIIVPFVTPYKVSYQDEKFRYTLPRNELLYNLGIDFWDGYKETEVSELQYLIYKGIEVETGTTLFKRGEVEEIVNTSGRVKTKNYLFRLDTYRQHGVVYKTLTSDEFIALQEYQNETGIQVIYPMTDVSLRPSEKEYPQWSDEANIWYKTKKNSQGKFAIDLDSKGNFQPIYLPYTGEDGYNSLRVEGETPLYDYSESKQDNQVRVRVSYYEYYVYLHQEIYKDKIEKPSFLFGTTATGQDILTHLASGARFSFILAICVSIVNLVVGAIYGAIEGYYGGKIDIVMERIVDLLSAIPSMVVISLLKYHLKVEHWIILLYSFFLTGWIGMASRTRMQFYRFKNQEYVLVARTLGANDRRIMFKHIFPNAIGTLITSCVLVIPGVIFSETSLSYLGIINLSTGNMTSVGTLLSKGQSQLFTYPHMLLFPALFISLLMLSFNLFGNGLRDAFNPSLRGSEE